MFTMKRISNILAIVLFLCVCHLNVFAWDSLNHWNLQYKDGSSSYWLPLDGGYEYGTTQSIGVIKDLKIDGFWIKATYDSYEIKGFYVSFFINNQNQGGAESTFNNYYQEYLCNKCGSLYSEVSGKNMSLTSQATAALNNPGNNQLKIRWQVKGNDNKAIDSQTKWSYVNFVMPGFTDDDPVTEDFGVKNRGSQPKTIVPYEHFGNTPTYTLEDGTYTTGGYVPDATKFKVSTPTDNGVTVQFDIKDKNLSVGNKYSAKLTLRDPDTGQTKEVTLLGEVGPAYPTPVIAYDPVLLDGPQVTLSGYVKLTGCAVIDTAGFIVAKDTEPVINQNTGSMSTGKKYGVPISEFAALLPKHSQTSYEQNDLFQRTIYKYDGNYLTEEGTYHYKVYLHSTTSVRNPEDTQDWYWFLSDAGTFTVKNKCADISGDTIYYTLDNTRDANLCELRFPTLSEAIADMKQSTTGHTAWINAANKVLKPIVVEVVTGEKAYGDPLNTNWDQSLESINTASISSYVPTPSSPGEVLIIRSKTPKNKPVFKGGLSLVKARNVVLKGLEIKREVGSSYTGHNYSAIELGYCDDGTINTVLPGTFANTKVSIINCKIEATAFTCIHAAACDGLVFDQCEFSMDGASTNSNDQEWGASVKFIGCKNVQFTRNSLKGSHCTTIWLQHTQNVLIMNSVFWNKNLFTANVAFIRPMMYAAGDDAAAANKKITNIGIYYNTFYLADHASSPYSVDYLRFGGPYKGSDGNWQNAYKNYDVSNIQFKWNNCYCYDDQIYQRNNNSTAFLGIDLTAGNFDSNNFWSMCSSDSPNDPSVQSQLAFGSNTTHVNVPDQVCRSTADEPDDLIIKGSGLNLGLKPNEDKSGLGIANSSYADRFKDLVRPDNGKSWTYGAFQKSNNEEVDEIIWEGSKDGKWDTRGNWVTVDGDPVNCSHSFSPDLKATIPAVVKQGFHTPRLYAWGPHEDESETDPRGKYPDEFVEAGRPAIVTSPEQEAAITKFAKHIILDDGATIRGVENLNDGTDRYEWVKGYLTVPRSKWVHVSSMINPFDASGPRDVQGQDFFMDGVPQVYLAQIKVGEDNVSWNKTYESIWTTIGTNEASAIRIPDQYGPKKLRASEYYKDSDVPAEKRILGDQNIQYTFWGRFKNESDLPEYTVVADKVNPLSNIYPANIKVSELAKVSGLSSATIYVYDYMSCSFIPANAVGASSVILSQQAFFVEPDGVTKIELGEDVFVEGNSVTDYEFARSAEIGNPYLTLKAENLYEKVNSVIQVTYDELKDDVFNKRIDARKLFNNMEPNLPELYITEYGTKLSTVTVPTLSRVIPLGLRVLKKMYVSFSLQYYSGLSQALLVDAQTGKEYDLLEGNRYNFELAAGTYEGRFFLNLGAADESGQGEITEVVESDAENANEIYIFNNGNGIVVSSTNGVNLQTAYITDMAGKTWSVSLDNPHYNVLNLVGSRGVYVITAVGDSATKTEKIIIK